MYNYKNILYLVSAIAAAEKAIHYSEKFTTALEIFRSRRTSIF
jgi:hypothetical protein